MAKLFLVPGGRVTISDPFWTIQTPVKQVLWTYTPNNYGGWSICQSINADESPNITRKEANLFAFVAESKLRVKLEVPA